MSQRANRLLPAGVLLVVVEGRHDVAFLSRISVILHGHDPGLPDLNEQQALGQLVFLPIGGGDLVDWTQRLAPLQQPEFFLFDREVPPATYERMRAVTAIRLRANCQACLTSKRCLECYLHRDAIAEACGVTIDVDDGCDVSDVLARRIAAGKGFDLNHLERRGRKRLRARAKRILNNDAVARMTVDRPRERDPHGEVIGWMQALADMLGPSPSLK